MEWQTLKAKEERSMDPREPEEFQKAAKLEMGDPSTLGKAKLDVSGLCTQVYKDTVLSQTNADLQSG